MILLVLLLFFPTVTYGAQLTRTPLPDEMLPHRSTPLIVSSEHAALRGRQTHPPFDAHLRVIVFGMGCFWGAERLFWKQPGVYSTQVGYSGGVTQHPTYEDVSTGRTGHAEVVRVVFDPSVVSLDSLLKLFWENHHVTQGFRQGNDVGTQYRSVIFATSKDQLEEALDSRARFQEVLIREGGGKITTEIGIAEDFFYAEEYHQQYLHKNPSGYCGLGRTRFTYPERRSTSDEL